MKFMFFFFLPPLFSLFLSLPLFLSVRIVLANTNQVGFTTSVLEMKENLNGLFAAGGGDGPEAMTAALKAAADLDWRPHAAKMAILITDAPPHGIGEYGDGFPNGSPDGQDPIVLARKMSAMGISIFVVACEPALSGYQHAVDFYQGLVSITSGLLVPLTTASLLSHVVIAAAGEVMDLDRLHREVGDSVLERMKGLSLSLGNEATDSTSAISRLVDQVATELHEKLLLRQENTKQLIIESIYRESEESTHNIRVWSHAPDIFTARPHIRKVIGSRLSQKYLDMRRASQQARLWRPAPTPLSGALNDEPTSTPKRQIVSQFAAFEAKPGLRVQASPNPPTNVTNLSTGTYRSSGMDMDDDGDDAFIADSGIDDRTATSHDNEVRVEGDDGQMLAYRHDAISLSQARRLAMQSLSRAS